MYRTPGTHFDHDFLQKHDEALEIISNRYDHVILARDMNVDVLKQSRACDVL